MAKKEEITRLLTELDAGREGASEALLPLVYEELRALARSYMKTEKREHTLQATALVHEAYLRLMGGQEVAWKSRAHYFRAAARAMRRILIDHARTKRSRKKGGERAREPVESGLMFIEETTVDVIDLDRAMQHLAAIDPRLVQVVEFRFFAGLTVEETAAAMEVSSKTIKREWRMAKAWLKKEIGMTEDRRPSA